jgi:hypothetical protein
MYLHNKYSQYYFNITNRAKSRILDKSIYTENHHIIPKSLGGGNDKSNLVRLTAREHFICHLLLPKFTEGNNQIKMFHAAWRMCCKSNKGNNQRDYKITSPIYKMLKEQRSLYLRGLAGPNHPNRGKKTGRTSEDFTPLWRKNLSDATKISNAGERNPMYGKTRTVEEKKKISKTRKSLAGTPGWNVRPPCNHEKAMRIKLANTGKKWVHNPENPTERKQLNPDDCIEYISIGWIYGIGTRQ